MARSGGGRAQGATLLGHRQAIQAAGLTGPSIGTAAGRVGGVLGGVLPEVALSEFGVGRLLDLVRDAVVLGEAESGRIVLWNQAAEAMFGYPRSEALGMPLENLVPERLRARHRAGLAGYAATGRDGAR